MRANTHTERKRELKRIGAACREWRVSHGLRLCDMCAFGISVQSISNFEYGLNDSALALECYTRRGYRGGVINAP